MTQGEAGGPCAVDADGQTWLWPRDEIQERPMGGLTGAGEASASTARCVDAETVLARGRRPVRKVADDVVAGDVVPVPLSGPVIEDAARILGEALVQQYQRDGGEMGVTGSGNRHGRAKGEGDG